jgi:AAHS family 4-hydroxybenzoate transporter-like MFS transporter
MNTSEQPPTPGARIFDVAALLDGRGLTAFHYRILLISCCITLFDGMDFAVMAYTAPYIRDEFGLSSSLLARVFSAAVLGQVLGGFLVTHIADRIGRRPTMIVASLVFGLLTLVTALARTYPQLLMIRFLDGLAIGGMLPVAWALNIEFAPRPRRGSVVALIMLGYSFGSASAGPLTNFVAPAHGWQGVYVWAGIGTLLAAGALYRWLPESVRFLVARRRNDSDVAAVLNRLQPALGATANDRFVLADEASTGAHFHVRQLFHGDLRFITPLLWAGYMASAFAIYLNSTWGPLLLEGLKVARPTAALVASIAGLLGAVGGLLLVRMTEHLGPRGVMICPAISLPLLLVLGLGFAPEHAVVPLILIFGTLLGAGHAALVSIAGIYYPSSIRASGGGWATSVSKCAAVLGPLAGGAILASHIPVIRIYAVQAIYPLVVCATMAGIAMVIRRR